MTVLLPSSRVSAGRPLRPALALLAVLWLAGCGPAGDATASPVVTNTVELPKSYRFAPAAITVPAGTTVTWTNHDDFTHNVRLLDGSGAVLTMQPGQTASHTFSAAGLHRYDCSLHPRDMQGSVLVR
jgi:plastocyanin